MTRVALVLLLCACGSKDGVSERAAGSSATASAASPGAALAPSASLSASAAPFDLGSYCRAVCERSTRCGLAAADAMAVKGDRVEAAALASAQKLLPETEAKCVKQCNASPVDEASRAILEAAQRCLKETECAPFQKCLEALAR